MRLLKPYVITELRELRNESRLWTCEIRYADEASTLDESRSLDNPNCVKKHVINGQSEKVTHFKSSA